MLDFKGLNKAQALAALYNASRPLGLGFMHYNPTPMTEAESQKELDRTTYFDYLNGRVMKLNMGKDQVDPWLYDRDNGEGAAQRAIDAAVAGNEAAIKEAHTKGVKEAAVAAKESMGTPISIEGHVINMTLNDVKDELGPKVDKALEY
jgi:hypothetical protein